MKHFLLVFILLCITNDFALAQNGTGDCTPWIGGGPAEYECFGCQFVREDTNVWQQNSISHRVVSSVLKQGSSAIVYNCTEGSGTQTLTASATTTAIESLTVGSAGSLGARIGVSAVVVADASFGLNGSSGTSSTVSNSATLSVTGVVSECNGVGLGTEYRLVTKAAWVTEYARIAEYLCDCNIDIGGGQYIVLDNVLVTYRCGGAVVRATGSTVQTESSAWLRGASFNPGRAPSIYSTSYCSWCSDDDPDGGDGGHDDDSCGCSDDLDPNGDQDGDGIPNGQDDTPFGYDGDNPDGDDDGDGIPNKDDATPYGYNGNDPDGDDDGDGIKNSMDPTPNGDFNIWPISNDFSQHPAFDFINLLS